MPRDTESCCIPTCAVNAWSPLEIVNLHFSADGNFIYFLRKLDPNTDPRGVFRIATLGGPVTPLATDARIVSPDGTKVVFYKHAKDPLAWAAVVPLAGGDPQTLKMPVSITDGSWFIWASDGKSILYVDVTSGVGNIWSAPLDGKSPRKLTAFDTDRIFAFDVSPDNRLVISRGSVVNDVVLIKNAMR